MMARPRAPFGPALTCVALLAACALPDDAAPAPTPAQGAAPEGATLSQRTVPGDLALSAAGREAFERLMVARRFTDDAIGDGGDSPNEVRALRRLFQEPEAAAAFAALEEHATLEGRLYALCGLYYADPARFRARVDPYRRVKAAIEYQSGCCIDEHMPVPQLVDLGDDARAVRLAPGESNREHLARRGGSLAYDIVGGGFPNLFRDGGGWGTVTLEPYEPEGD